MQDLFSQPNCSKSISFMRVVGEFLDSEFSNNFCLNLFWETYTLGLLRSSSGYSSNSHLAAKECRKIALEVYKDI